MAYEELFPTKGPAPAEAKIVVAPADIDISPQISISAPKTPFPAYYALLRAGQTLSDVLKIVFQENLIIKLKNQLPGIVNTPQALCTKAKTLSPEALRSTVLAEIGTQYKFLMDAWKAGIGAGMGASYASEIEQFTNTGQLLYAYSALQYQYGLIPRMQRAWMKEYTPTIPNTSMAFNLLKRGKINDAKFAEYASYDGWDAQGIEFLKEIWKSVPNTYTAFQLHVRGHLTDKEYKDYLKANGWPDGWDYKIYHLYEALPSIREAYHLWTKKLINTAERDALYHANGLDGRYNELMTANFRTLPTAHEGFYLWRKGLLDKTQRDGLYSWHGYDPAWHEIITENWMYTPTIYDLTRLADYVELDPVWAMDVMKRRGVREADIAKIWEMIQLRPLRDEIRDVTDTWIFRAKYGRATIETLDAEFTSLGIRTKEKGLLLEKAQMDYEDELITEWVEVLIWRFRTALITEEEFLKSLIETGIREEKANIMVELEKAKGYYGYY
jgi:hypothetical protein